jgi:hypothetical protein
MAFAAATALRACGYRLTQRARLTLRWSSAKLSSSRLAECDEVLFGE